MISLYNVTNACEIPIKIIKFPCGETLVNIPEMSNYIRNRDALQINCMWENAEDTMNTLQLKDILCHYKVDLFLPYVPYSRQDRRANEGDSHSLAVFANIINSAGFNEIRITDPHSDVVEALFPNARITRQHDCLKQAFNRIGLGFTYDAIIAPDMGASKKAEKAAKMLGIPMIQCTKIRDPATGKLSSAKIEEEMLNLVGNRLLVVDDLIDRGGTFIQLAAEIFSKAKNTPIIDLYITHGFFTAGKQVVYDAGYSNIICLNDFTKLGETK